MKLKNMLIILLLFIILSIQFLLEIIITSDIPMKVSNSDIFTLLLLSSFQFLFVLKFIKERSFLNIVLSIFVIFFVLDFVKIYSILNLEIKKTYMPVAIEIISIFSSILLCLFRKQQAKGLS